MKKHLIPAVALLLTACQPENNMAGLDRVYVKPVTTQCLTDVITAQPFVADFSTDKDVFHFTLDGYETRMLNKKLDGKISGYAMTIDGMRRGDDPNAFYKKVREMETTIFTSITETCY